MTNAENSFRRRVLGDLVDDLDGGAPAGERALIIGAIAREAAELLLLRGAAG